jgi:hypothetical protein
MRITECDLRAPRVPAAGVDARRRPQAGDHFGGARCADCLPAVGRSRHQRKGRRVPPSAVTPGKRAQSPGKHRRQHQRQKPGNPLQISRVQTSGAARLKIVVSWFESRASPSQVGCGIRVYGEVARGRAANGFAKARVASAGRKRPEDADACTADVKRRVLGRRCSISAPERIRTSDLRFRRSTRQWTQAVWESCQHPR